MKVADMAGKRFGKLLVIKRVENNKHGGARWLCKCDCGNESIVTTSSLNNSTKSCGCYMKETATQRSKEMFETHGMSNTITYSSYRNMLIRCGENADDYHRKRYKEKGIKICKRWLISFENFLNDMGQRPTKSYSLERIDNNKGYSKDNCRWATKVEQARNRDIRVDNKTGCSGVHLDKVADVYVARITINGKRIVIGKFKKLDDAIEARKTAVIKYWDKGGE